MHSRLATESDTQLLGVSIADRLRPRDAVLLDGPLGAGKSTLARALLRHLMADPALDVPSPSYTLVQTYDTPRGPVHHFDLWRLDDAAALEELGWSEACADIVIVEWPDRLGPWRPANALTVWLGYDGDARRVRLDGWDGRI